eukprot:m.64679 g.64679  ORF g.64679 m.64679 type:complete len:931 (-) comp7280_c0_seq1:25-2817(-)
MAEREALLTRLVQHVVRVQEGTEAFIEARAQAARKLKFHSFPDVDSHKIRRHYQGLAEKFHVHAQPKKAESLSASVETFLQLPVSAIEPLLATDLHFGMLQLVSLLSSAPVRRPEYRPPSPPAPPRPASPVDWRQVLYGRPVPQPSALDSEDESGVGDERPTTVPASYLLPCAPPMPNAPIEDGLGDIADDYAVLQAALRRPEAYVAPLIHPRAPATLVHSPIDTWDLWASSAAIRGAAPVQRVDEKFVVREVATMLSGLPTRLFAVTSAACTCARADAECRLCRTVVAADVRIDTFTPASLASLLRKLAAIGTTAARARAALACLRGVPLPTIIAFTDAAHILLQDYFVGPMLAAAEQSATLLRLYGLARRAAAPLARLWAILCETILPRLQAGAALGRATVAAVLQAAYDGAVAEEMEAAAFSLRAMPVRELFVRTVGPLLDCIDTWANLGLIVNEAECPIVPRDGADLTSSFSAPGWDDRFELCFFDPDGVPPMPRTTGGARSYTYNGHLVPRFLWPFLGKLLIAGKAAAVLDSRGIRSGTMLDLRASFQANMGLVLTYPVASASSGMTPALARIANDPVLVRSFSACAITGHHTALPALAAPDAPDGQRPFEDACRATLAALIGQRFEFVNDRAMRHLVNDCRLYAHIEEAQDVFLMRAGDAMASLCRVLCETARDGQHYDAPWLTVVLNTALGDSRRDNLVGRFSFSGGAFAPTDPDPLGAFLSALRVEANVPWPASMVLNAGALECYNKVFRMFMRLHRARWALEHVHLKDCGWTPRLHKVLLLRTQLLHVVRCLHEYAASRILHSTCDELDARLVDARDIDAVLAAHSTFCQTLIDRCFLREENLMRGVIDKLLTCAIEFGRQWDARADAASSLHPFRALHADYMRLHDFLEVLLRPFVQNGGFPHLEALSVSLGSRSIGLAW